VDWSVDANILEKHAMSVFRAEMMVLGIRRIIQGGRKGSAKIWASEDGMR
jgi:hypothetical protein